jgi:peptidoglycan hydrolase CwlO-like protein
MKPISRSRRRALLCAAAGLVAATLANAPATASDLEALRDQAQEVADEVTSLEHELESLATRRADLDAEIAVASRDIGLLGLELRDAKDRLESASGRYVARAVEAYKAGPAGRLALLLSADDVTDMISIAEANRETAQADTRALRRLEAARRVIAEAGARIERRKGRLLAARSEAEEVALGIDETLNERRAALEELTTKIEELELQARREARLSARKASQRPPGTSEAALGGTASGEDPTGGSPGAGRGEDFIGTGVTFEGLASWYGPGFEGNLTASGDVFHAAGLTAASRDLPLGTWLRVTREGASVIVLVNDRGPYIEERVLDLSQGAAQRLGITGVEWVTAEILLER